MKKILNWQFFLGIFLISLSAFIYYIHYVIFRDAHHIFIYLIGDIAFVFFEVLLVTLILHQLLVYREKKAMLKKLNMVIGAFFSEVGTGLMKAFSGFDPQSPKLAEKLIVEKSWSEKDFFKARREIRVYKGTVDVRRGNAEGLRSFLKGKRNFLLTLLENPNLLEHESFTNLLWAVFHLTEELERRKDLGALPVTDYEHLSNDVNRAYKRLLLEWLAYMRHLKRDYPYLFSLAMRTNPFDTNACIEIKK